MKKTRRKFVLYAGLAVFISLVILLGIINVLVFTTAAEDADAITKLLSDSKGAFDDQFAPGFPFPDENNSNADEKNDNNRQSKPDGFPEGGLPFGFGGKNFGPMGIDSPEIADSLRYFTISFDKEENATVVALNISAVDEEQATAWARSLLKGSTGWTKGSYRYRVFKQGGKTYVTVIDQGREMIMAYRILIYSVCGTVIFVAISIVALWFVGKKLFNPLEEADRKQKKFIAAAEQEFKVPLTVINADTEIIERENGPTEQTRSIHRQVNKMDALVRNLGTFAIFDDGKAKEEFDIGALFFDMLTKEQNRFELAGIEINKELETVMFNGSKEAFVKVFDELLENTLRYAETKAEFKLSKSGERIKLVISNDTKLQDGSVNQVFDRFVTLDNVKPGCSGLGLAYVKEIVDRYNGRESAKVENGMFILSIDL